MNLLKYLLRISRFRFWIYTGGTYVVGYVLGTQNFLGFLKWEYFLYLFYFFFPANIFIYGVNDYFDIETDKNNPKKKKEEELLSEEKKKELKKIIIIVTLVSLGLMLFQNANERIAWGLFLFLSYFYSAKPLRFKAIPVLDFSSNLLYIMPGVFGYYLASNSWPSLLLVLAGFFHVSAMHLFSAIPDIEYDREAGIKTSAVFFGKRDSLVLTTFFWIGLAVLVIHLSFFHPLSFLSLIYPLTPLCLLVNRKLNIRKVYWYLPVINTTLGGLLTFTLLLRIIFKNM